jgi:hypothetical protein
MHYNVYSITSIELEYTTRRWCWQCYYWQYYYVFRLHTLGQAEGYARLVLRHSKGWWNVYNWNKLYAYMKINWVKEWRQIRMIWCLWTHQAIQLLWHIGTSNLYSLSLCHGNNKGKVAPVLHALIEFHHSVLMPALDTGEWSASPNPPPPKKQSAQSLYVNTSHNSKFGCIK